MPHKDFMTVMERFTAKLEGLKVVSTLITERDFFDVSVTRFHLVR